MTPSTPFDDFPSEPLQALTTATPDGTEMYAVCVDKNTGKILLELDMGRQDQPTSDQPASVIQRVEMSDLLAKAESAKTRQEKDLYYLRAAIQASQSDDPDQALSIVEKISTDQMKATAGTVVRLSVAMRAFAVLGFPACSVRD